MAQPEIMLCSGFSKVLIRRRIQRFKCENRRGELRVS